MRKLSRFIIGVPVALLVGWVLLVIGIYAYSRRDEARRADVIVVLGAAQYDGRPSPVFRARLDHALKLYEDGLAGTIITTGGVGPGDTVSEAVVGRRYAIRKGVPASAVLTERSGERSAQSMRSVVRMMRSRNLDSAILVSDPFHMLRLRLLALGLGMRVYSSPTRTSPISGDPETEWKFIVRESFSLPATLLLPDQ